MNFGKISAMVFAGLAMGATAHAQFGVYGMFSVTQYTGVQCVSTAVACSNGTVAVSASGVKSTGSISPTGLSGGAYYDFKTVGPVRLGVDLRAGANHANKSASSSAGGDNVTGGSFYLGGVRGSVHTPISWLKPYAQVSLGYAHSDVTEPTSAQGSGASPAPRYFDSFVQYEGFVGADIHVLPIIDLRAFEVGIGNMNRIGNGSSQDGSSSVGVRSLGAGVVIHLP